MLNQYKVLKRTLSTMEKFNEISVSSVKFEYDNSTSLSQYPFMLRAYFEVLITTEMAEQPILHIAFALSPL